MTRIARFAVSVLTLLFLPLAHCSQAQGDPDARVRAICEHWRQRQAELPCVSYAWRATTTWSGGAFAETAEERAGAPNPPADVTSTSRRSLLLDFAHNRHKATWDDETYGRSGQYRLQCHSVCDGTTKYSRIFENSDPALRTGRKKTHVDLLIQKGRFSADVFERGDFLTVLIAHGVVAYGDEHPRPGRLIPTTEFEGLKYHREDVYQGRVCSVLTTWRGIDHWTEFWVDPELNDAIVKVVVQAGRPYMIFELGYVRANGTLVLARSSRREFDMTDGRLRIQEDCEATAVETAPKLEDVAFRIDPAPGQAVEEVEYYLDDASQVARRDRYYQLDDAGREIELDRRTLLPRQP